MTGSPLERVRQAIIALQNRLGDDGSFYEAADGLAAVEEAEREHKRRVDEVESAWAAASESEANALDRAKAAEAKLNEVERQLNDMPSLEAFEYLTELRERHVEQIKALEQKNRKAEARAAAAEQLVRDGISGVENLGLGDAERWLREEWLPRARDVLEAQRQEGDADE